MSVFRRDIIASYTSQIVVVLCNFICSILAARMLGAKGQGDLALYSSFTGFVTLLIGMGLPSALVYFIASKKIEKGKVIPLLISATVLFLMLFVMLFFTAKEMGFMRIFLPNFILENTLWSYVLIVHLLLLMMSQYFNSLLQAEGQFTRSGILSIVGSVLLLTLYWIQYSGQVNTGIMPIYWIVGSLFLVAGIQYFVQMLLLFRIDRTYFAFQHFAVFEIQSIVAFALLAYVANLVQFLNYKMDLWFINYYHNSKEMIGVYALSATLAQIVWHLPNALHNVLYTYVSSNSDWESKLRRAAKSSHWLLLYGIAAGVLGYLLSIWLVPIWFGDEFSKGSQIIGILLFGIIPFCYGIGISAFFAGIHKVYINMYASMIGLIFCVILDIWWIPDYGIVGAAYASVISYLASTIFLFINFKRIQNSDEN
mgnify:FL=1